MKGNGGTQVKGLIGTGRLVTGQVSFFPTPFKVDSEEGHLTFYPGTSHPFMVGGCSGGLGMLKRYGV
jgi:hypothetical protein